MIARRRSNSSYSSTTSPHRSSFEGTPPTKPKSTKANDGKKKNKKFEFAKPEAKKISKKNSDNNSQNYDIVNEIKKSVDKKKQSESLKNLEGEAKNNNKSDDVILKKNDNVFNIIVDTKSSKSKNLFKIKVSKNCVFVIFL